jgi:CRP-like cAMP-binding protein
MKKSSYFGEISLLCQSLTSAKVTAIKYCTFGVLSGEIINKLNNVMPLIKALKRGCEKYKDPQITFITNQIQQLPYFKNLKNFALFDIIFSLKITFLQNREILQNIGEEIASIYFVEYGIVEVKIFIDEQKRDFVIDRLYRGSIINADLFHTSEQAQV